MKQEGWGNLYGIELSDAAAKKAQSKGFNVKCGMVEDILNEYPDNYFDVVISSMVIGTSDKSFLTLQNITKKLKPGGEFLFSTINRRSLDAIIYKKFWACFDFPRHMVYFSKRDIKGMLKENYRFIEIVGQIEPIDFIRSSKWRYDEKKNWFDKFILNTSQKNLFYCFHILSSF